MPDQEVKSIAEQIVEDLFNRLQRSEVYNEAVITKLKQAASNGKLTSFKTITDAISTP
jgi:hypothetical protein